MPLYLVKTLIIIFKVFLVLALNLMIVKHVMLMHFEFKMETIVFARKAIMIIIMTKQFAINARELGTQIIFIIYKILVNLAQMKIVAQHVMKICIEKQISLLFVLARMGFTTMESINYAKNAIIRGKK